jgi:hypothetical protein
VANNRGKQIANIQRVTVMEVTPIEIWDCIVPNGILWDFMYTETFPQLLKSVIRQVHEGSAIAASGEIIPERSLGFDSLYICGGGAQNRPVIEAIQELCIHAVFAEDPVFSSAKGGQRLLENIGLRGPTIDVGQTQIKISSNGVNRAFKRDFDTLAVRTGQRGSLIDEQLTSFYSYVSDSIKQCINVTTPPEAIVLALPCSITTDCTLGESSYIGMKGNNKMISTIVGKAGLEGAEVLLLNDAELTGYTALSDPRLAGYKKTLVLTLGFGVGASIMEPKCN